jgi:XTP/dITP diphosphohydrolase
MEEILVATGNPGKRREYEEVLGGAGFTLYGLDSYPDYQAPEETGSTFYENAILKAKSAYDHTGLPTIADDGGFEIDALNGEPGVMSHRWIDPTRESDDQELVQYTLQRMRDIPWDERDARLRLVMVYYDGNQIEESEASIDGKVIQDVPGSYEPGFPYRALLWVSECGKLYDELSEEEHERLNHRRQALKGLLPSITKQ